MALVSAILGGTFGFIIFLIAFFLLGVPLATASSMYIGAALVSMISLNMIALTVGPNHDAAPRMDQFS